MNLHRTPRTMNQPTKQRRRRRRRHTTMGCTTGITPLTSPPSALLLSLATIVIVIVTTTTTTTTTNKKNNRMIMMVHATNNFCGTTWGDASSNCDARQPCPLGTDEECQYGGGCWGDTTCSTTLGHGKYFDRTHPEHVRFCGTSWNDANDNCESSRHCPSGDKSECEGDEECYSFLSACHYVDMVGGPENAAAGGSGDGSGGGGGGNKLPKDDPSRSNYCGSDWNNALLSCSQDDHWCPTGSDTDCPDGKICFAGTDCKYESDLSPTITPTTRPTDMPSPSPIEYNKIENTRFCGEGWEDARTTCRIGSHCPSGSNADCKGSQVCFGWITGCNILDFEDYFTETGEEIFGADHWLLPEESWSSHGDGGDGANSGAEGASLPSANIQTPQLPPNDIQITPNSPPRDPPPGRPTTSRPTESPTEYDPNKYRTENHIFCGATWTDASERCSQETFCADGAATRCDDSSDYCWVGVSACNAGDWVPTAEPSGRPSVRPTRKPSRKPTRRPTRRPSRKPTRRPTRKPTRRPVSSPQSSTSETSTPGIAKEEETQTTTTTIRQSYCATDFNHLKQKCAELSTCNRYKPCPDDYKCFSNFKCTITVTAPKPVVVQTTSSPITFAPISNAPVTQRPTQNPTILTLSDNEVAQRLTNMNNYCAESLSQVMSSCSYSLYTCNDGDAMCGAGTFCFQYMVCPDPEAVTSKPTPSPTPPPSPNPVYSSINNLGSGESGAISAAVVQNYCAQSEQQLRATCSTAPTCNDDDGPCPAGMICFGNQVCNDSSEKGTSSAVAVMPTPTMNPTTSQPSPKPVSLSDVWNMLSDNPLTIGNDGNTDAVEVLPQNYCAKSKEALQSSCSNAETCNDGDGPCPSGSFCFGDYLCESNASLNKPIVAMSNTNTGNAPANYCAQSAQQLAPTCAWAPTCNDGDGPCPPDTFCYSNVVCESRIQTALEVTPKPPTAMPTPPKILDDEDATSIDPECENLCLWRIDGTQCDYVLSVEIDILPCTTTGVSAQHGVKVGDLCTGTGRCGTDPELNNCRSNNNDQDIYIRLGPAECIQHGLVGGGGVIFSTENADNESGGGNYNGDTGIHLQLPNTTSIGLKDSETAREVSTNSALASGNNEKYFEWEDRPSDNVQDDNGDQERGGLTGWWLKENSSAAGTTVVVGWKKTCPIAALEALVVIASFLFF